MFQNNNTLTLPVALMMGTVLSLSNPVTSPLQLQPYKEETMQQTTSENILANKYASKSTDNLRKQAMKFYGEQMNLTAGERKTYEEAMKKKSIPLGINIFDIMMKR